MRNTLFVFIASVSIFAYAGKYEPIYNPVIEYEEGKAAKDVEAAIKKSLIGRGWRVIESENGLIKAKLNIRAHTATISITYGNGKVTFEYVSSTNLSKTRKGKELIHRNYNRWIRYLEQDIGVYLT